jgi:hypothetical protein
MARYAISNNAIVSSASSAVPFAQRTTRAKMGSQLFESGGLRASAAFNMVEYERRELSGISARTEETQGEARKELKGAQRFRHGPARNEDELIWKIL